MPPTKDKALFASSGTFEISEHGIGRRGKRRAKQRTRAGSLIRAENSQIAYLNSLQGRKKFPARMRRELARKAVV